MLCLNTPPIEGRKLRDCKKEWVGHISKIKKLKKVEKAEHKKSWGFFSEFIGLSPNTTNLKERLALDGVIKQQFYSFLFLYITKVCIVYLYNSK